MHITKDRIILLDSAPVLSNRGKKDFVLSELDDIRRIIFLLSVCHVLIVMQEDYFNINFVRLLRCAEMMIQRDKKDMQFLNPRILFVKNNCSRKNFALQDKTFHESICRQLFRETKLKINSNQDDKEQINVLYFPKLSYGKIVATDLRIPVAFSIVSILQVTFFSLTMKAAFRAFKNCDNVCL